MHGSLMSVPSQYAEHCYTGARCVGFAVAQCPLLFSGVHCSSRYAPQRVSFGALGKQFHLPKNRLSRANENTSIIYQFSPLVPTKTFGFSYLFPSNQIPGSPGL